MITNIPFFKYHGAGNDFILIDNRQHTYDALITPAEISRLCHRQLGIGADGLMLLQDSPTHDFEMLYFNSDGHPGSMCGNGGRCIVAFANRLHVPVKSGVFLASDGPHAYKLISPSWVELQLQDVHQFEKHGEDYILDTGSPHYVCFSNDLDSLDIVFAGRQIRYNDRFSARGINVNFVREASSGLTVYTYERGVENETLSCGTGVTAAAIAYAHRQGLTGDLTVPINTKGGNLEVKFRANMARFEAVWLCGPATLVFEGLVQ
jgi:diaminopimelate epimerase